MKRMLFLALMPLLLLAGPAAAQSWGWGEPGPRRGYDRGYRYDVPPWSSGYRVPPPRYRESYRSPFWFDDEDEDDFQPRRRQPSAKAPAQEVSGGPRPVIQPIGPERVPYHGPQSPGTIVIDTSGRQLLLTEAGGTALRYPISVGREGFSWTGEEKISRIADWPDWHPPAEMRERDPKLPIKMTGGLRNPLGAKALYLGSTLYRIHGTNDANSIGRASSSGCFRMLNGQVLDLATRVGVGTKVVVVSSLRTVGARLQ